MVLARSRYAVQFDDVGREVLGGGVLAAQRVEVTGSVPGARPSPRSMRPGQRLERAEQLDDVERRVVRDHDPAGAERIAR